MDASLVSRDAEVMSGALCFTCRMRHMDVNPCLLAGEEKQSKLAVADDGWCHVWTVADGGMAARGSAALWLFSSRRKALILLAHHMACFALPNVRVKPAAAV